MRELACAVQSCAHRRSWRQSIYSRCEVLILTIRRSDPKQLCPTNTLPISSRAPQGVPTKRDVTTPLTTASGLLTLPLPQHWKFATKVTWEALATPVRGVLITCDDSHRQALMNSLPVRTAAVQYLSMEVSATRTVSRSMSSRAAEA